MLSIVVLSFCVASAVAGPFYGPPLLSPAPIVAPVPIALDTKTQYHYQDDFGFGTYGHSEPHGYHHASHDHLGNKQGEFSYLKPDGTIHKTRYIADSAGYRVASNDLPIGPSAHILRKRSIAYPYAPTPIITPSGHLADTPEVAAAKAAHFLEHAKRGNYHIASSAIPAATPHTVWTPPGSLFPGLSWAISPYTSGHPVVTPDGYLKETPEVAQAKAAHLAEKLKVSQYWGGYDPIYKPYAPITADGQVTDTPEVSAAKHAHFAAHSAALARTGGAVGDPYAAPQYDSPATYVSSSGVPADTPEVALAKAAHYAEYERVANRQKRSILPASTQPLLDDVYPILPNVLPHPIPALPPHPWNVIHHLPPHPVVPY